MQNTTQSVGASSPAAAAGGLNRLITPDTKIAVGAWLLCMTGLVALINPSDLPASAFFRLSLAATGFALYAWGRTDKQRQQATKDGISDTQFLNGLSGWLILLAAMLWVTLLGAVLQAMSDVPQIIRGNLWVEYTTPGRAGSNEMVRQSICGVAATLTGIHVAPPSFDRMTRGDAY